MSAGIEIRYLQSAPSPYRSESRRASATVRSRLIETTGAITTTAGAIYTTASGKYVPVSMARNAHVVGSLVRDIKVDRAMKVLQAAASGPVIPLTD